MRVPSHKTSWYRLTSWGFNQPTKAELVEHPNRVSIILTEKSQVTQMLVHADDPSWEISVFRIKDYLYCVTGPKNIAVYVERFSPTLPSKCVKIAEEVQSLWDKAENDDAREEVLVSIFK